MAAFPLDIRTELHLAGSWTDISSDVYLRDQKVISRGRRDQGATTDPSSLSLTLNNRDGRYAPRNAMSPLYGLIGRNTRVRLSVPDSGGSFLQSEFNGSQFASTPDTAALDITGDMDVRAELTANWYGPENQMVIGKWDTNTDQRSWVIRIYKGLIWFHYSTDGTSAGLWYAANPLPVMPSRAAIRMTFDANSGSGNREVRFYWAESLAGPWTDVGAPIPLTGAAPIYASSAPLSIAPSDLTGSDGIPRLPFSGRGYRFEVRNGIGGALVAAPDFTTQAAGTSSFTDSAGRVWSLSGGAEIRDRADRFVGEISSWPTQWTLDGSDVWTPIQASGILRRLGQGQKPLDSTLRRRIPSGDPVAYWPFEDASTSTRAYSPLPGVEPAAISGIEFAALTDLPSSAPLPRLTKSGSMSAKVPMMPSGQWQVEFVYNADDKPPADYAELATVISPDGTVRRWQITMKKGIAHINGFDASGRLIQPLFVSIGDVFHGWVRLRLYSTRDSPGVTRTVVSWQNVGGLAAELNTRYGGTAGRVSYVSAAWGEGTEGWGFGHLTVLPSAANTLMDGSDDAYLGETAWGRMSRLAQEEHIPISRVHGNLPAQLVGYQRQDAFLSVMEDAAEADGGMLLEDPSRLGLIYRDRSSLYTQDPALTLSYTAPGLGPDLEPVDDDSAVRNDITVTRDGGTSGRAFLAEGPLSVQAPPDGIGRYDESLTLSLADDTQPEPVANWLLHLGTHDGARYPTVSVILHKPGAEKHIPAVLGLREGDVIRLTDLPPWVAHGDVDLIVEGWTETLDLYQWTLHFNCSPGGPWNVAQADHPVYAKADTDGSTLSAAVSATDKTLTVTTTVGRQWTSDPRDAPIPVQFGGEVARVDAVGQLLNLNPWLDRDATDWLPQSASISRVLAPSPVHPKAIASLRIVPDGVAAGGGATTDRTPVGSITPGLQYRVCGWVYSPTGWSDIQPCLDWYNASNSYLSTGYSLVGFAVPAGQWTYLEQTFTAPANASRAVLRARHGGTPAASKVWYAWGFRLIRSVTSGAAIRDTFTRSVVNGWGTADTGQPWTRFGGTASDFSVNGSQGVISHTTRNVFRYAALTSLALADVETLTQFTVPIAPTGDGVYLYVASRADATVQSFYFARIWVATNGSVELSIRKRVPAESLLATSTTKLAHTPGTSYKVRFRVEGSALSARFWRAQDQEPDVWHVTATDTDLKAPGCVAFRSYISSTNTNTLPVLTPVDEFTISDAQAFTVTRSVNGVTKAHSASTPLRLAHPAIASL